MSIIEKKFRSLDSACSFLESLVKQDYLFRGHTNYNYKLQSTLSRFSKYVHEIWNTRIDEMLNGFKSGLIRLGPSPFESDNRLDWLEYARHYGMPSPCIDLTYSPYIALFFAYNGVRPQQDRKKVEYSVIYAINVQQLATAWADTTEDPTKRDSIYQRMLYPGDAPLFKDGFPPDILQFIPLPGRHSLRMQRQCGAFLYDTVQYTHLGFRDLEDLIERSDEPGVHYPNGVVEEGKPIVYRVCIDQNLAPSVFQKLELMGITAGSLFNNPEGIVDDVKNSYYYVARIPYLRDVIFPNPEDEN